MGVNHRNLRRLNTALCLALAFSCVESGAGEVQYHWVNAQGEVVYSDRPPPAGVDYQVIDTQPGLIYDQPGEPATGESADESVRSSEGDAAGKAENDESLKNAGLCEKAKMNLIALQSQGNLNVSNDEGITRKLSTEDREFAIENARKQIERYCD